jgi:hypothetical protein
MPVSNSHFTYEDSKKFIEYQIETLWNIREGLPDSQLEGCFVNPVRCRICRATIGVRCVDAPEGKAQFRYVTYFKYPQGTPVYFSEAFLVYEYRIYFYAPHFNSFPSVHALPR